MTTRWLLDVDADGRTYRWSDLACTVQTTAGETLAYSAGLGSLEVAVGDEPEVAIADRSVDWPVVAPQIDGRTCALRRWTVGTKFEQAEVYALGEATELQFGARHDPVTLTIARPVGSSDALGTQVPDPLARVDATTWQVTALHSLGTEGASYPVIFGVPGYTVSSKVSEQVVPVPIAQWKSATTATTYVVVSEDPEAPITQVRVRNDSTSTTGLETVVRTTDKLGRPILVAHFTNDGTPMPGSTDEQMYAGYRPATGGGVARTAYEVLVYLLRRWGGATVDWGRLPEVREAISPFLVDTWIDQAVQDPWAWIESVLLPDLPLELRVGAGGRYFVHRRYVSDRTRVVGALSADRGECSRVSLIQRAGDPVNELTAYYRRSRDGDWLGRVTIAGSAGLVSKPDQTMPGATTSQEFTLVSSSDCTRSLARYGLRQGEALTLDWTWDTPTVGQVLGWRVQRDAMPGLLVSYDVPHGEDLQEGDEVELTDSELGWSAAAAIVDEPPMRGTSTTALFRLPESPG